MGIAVGQTSGIEKTVKSAAAVSTAYTIAKFGSDDETMALTTAATDNMVGVFQHTTSAAAERVRVMLTGISRLKLGGTVARGDRLTTDASGLGIVATRHIHTENTAASYTQDDPTDAATEVNTLGIAMASGVSGDIIPVLLLPSLA